MTARTIGLPVVVVFVAIAGGCVHYEYDLVRPSDLSRHVGTKEWAIFRVDDLEYRLRTLDDRLVALIYNTGERTVKLSGTDSAAIDPRGESHPLQSRTIPTGSYIKLILPPPQPQVRPYGPTLGFGVGLGYTRTFSGAYRDGFGYGSGLYDDIEPRYYSVYDPNDRTYFDWPGETELRLLLAYEPEGGERFRHEFAFRRRRV